ncbi:polysaccharide pyruvyl transferase family protein [Labrys sp. LIt4]|uniref:polysaccharide pyruvyl transferase family protein n=1 Tax=Labrys sp. LIt4 TaxID=2821355 RepID=UPI001FD82E2B|nr:polysaccharide pyruvyl transferase family protein [Labrys sp. LIt4]
MALHRIGVLTFHRCINYGSYWQARCLVEGLRAMGHDAVLLDHSSTKANRREWRCALQPQPSSRGLGGDRRTHALKTREFFDAFARLPLSMPFSTEDPGLAEEFDIVLVGSDEVWNLRHPWYGGYPIFYGKGLKTDRLVAYAASFGNHPASDGLPDQWAALLANFTAISVRDENSEQLVRGALGLAPEVVVDPCLLFPSVIDRGPIETETPYVAVYGHGFPKWFAAAAAKWASSSGLRLVSVGYRNDWADAQQIAAGPERFATLMAGATAVVTNFFHGCVFALLNAKPFACVSSDYRANKVRDLMQTAGSPLNLVTEANVGTVPGLLEAPPGPEVRRRLDLLRARSLDYLRHAVAP